MLKIGMIGTDTSHATIFTEIINDINHPFHVPGGRVVAAYAGGSPDFPVSIDRVRGFMERLKSEFGVRELDSPEEVAETCDAILLESADGRAHPALFRKIAPLGKPVFIDKPLALSVSAAREIEAESKRWRTPVMSSSSLRYAERLTEDLERYGASGITSAEASGPLYVEETQSYFYWYGIHSVELLYAAMGPGCTELRTESRDSYDLIAATWKDGRQGTVRCNREGDFGFGATIRREGGRTSAIDIQTAEKPFYASLVERIMPFFRTGRSPIDWNETMEIVRFLEAAEQSRDRGATLRL